MLSRFSAFALLPFLLIAPALADDVPAPPQWQQWVAEVRAEAAEEGISEATLDAAFTGLDPHDRVIELDRRQPEFTQTFQEYLAARVSPTRVRRGREMMAVHREALAAMGERFGVQPRFIAAIWGLETNYGATTGKMSVIRSLATLAWDRRRAAFFRGQLISALKIVDAGHITADGMIGSWAGAMGQPQFMPSSFLAYAQDGDQDGRRDIWTNETDVFASIAHYLAIHGWNAKYTWGRQVRLPADWAARADSVALETAPRSCGRALKHHSRRLPLGDWQALGVRRADGTDLPQADIRASLVRPGGAEGPAYLTYGNYRAILRYNCSNLYAMAVSHLADALLGAR